jgi:hypothetical protein
MNYKIKTLGIDYPRPPADGRAAGLRSCQLSAVRSSNSLRRGFLKAES